MKAKHNNCANQDKCKGECSYGSGDSPEGPYIMIGPLEEGAVAKQGKIGGKKVRKQLNYNFAVLE